MNKTKSFTEDEIRHMIREEISYIMPEFEILTDNDLTSEEKRLVAEAEAEYERGETFSFDEVYDDVMKD